jgi:hypothetical protein
MNEKNLPQKEPDGTNPGDQDRYRKQQQGGQTGSSKQQNQQGPGTPYQPEDKPDVEIDFPKPDEPDEGSVDRQRKDVGR